MIEMILYCPMCHQRHIDKGEFIIKPHHTHACQSCGNVWRPALHNTIGVHFLPGFKAMKNDCGHTSLPKEVHACGKESRVEMKDGYGLNFCSDQCGHPGECS